MSLEEKLRRISERKREKNTEIDWNRQRDMWIGRINALFGDIENWLKRYVEKNYILLSFYEKKIIEEHIGEYSVNVIEIDMGEALGIFEPMGRNVIGADGMVYVYLSGHVEDKKTLLLMEDDPQNFHWELWPSKNKRDVKRFDREVLEEILEEWLEYC